MGVSYVCPNGHEIARSREFISVRCETPGCVARIAYQPVGYGMSLHRENRELREALKRAVGCTGADGCLGAMSRPKCEPCLTFAREHLWTGAEDPIDLSSTPEPREVEPKGKRRGPLPNVP